MDTERHRLARTALTLVEAGVRNDSRADELLLDGFDDVGQAAEAHAYLAGFLLQLLAASRGTDPASAARFVRRTMDTTGA